MSVQPNATFGHFLFGLRSILITNEGGTLQASLDASQTAEFEAQVSKAMFEGDDVIKAILSFIKGGTLKMKAASFSSSAFALLTGIDPTASGTTPNEIETSVGLGAGRFPYVKVYANSYDDGTGGVQMLIHKAKITSNFSFKFEFEGVYMSEFELTCVPDATGKVFSFIIQETPTALPTS